MNETELNTLLIQYLEKISSPLYCPVNIDEDTYIFLSLN